MNRKLVIAFIGLALVFGGLLFFFDPSSTGKHTVPKRYFSDWDEAYQTTNPNPRNISFFMKLLKAHTKDSVYIAQYWEDFDSLKLREKATYLFIGEEFELDDEDYDSLVHYADSGATVFFSYILEGSNSYKRHFKPNAYYWDYSKNLYAWIGDTSLKYSYVYQNDTLFADWYFFNPNKIKDTNYVSYAFAMDKPFAFYSKRGKGKIHFHSIPRLFENYQVITSNGYAHAELILKHIPENQPVVLLQFADYSSYMDDENDEDENIGNKQNTSLIQFILDNPSLRLAFLLAILLAIIYVLFWAKRREIIIPGSPEKRNMGLAFVETLSSIYITRNSPIGILKVMRKNFYNAVNRHFYVDLNRKETREQETERLIERSGRNADEVKKIVNGLQSARKDITYPYLAEVYQNIRKFYEETGIIQRQKHFVASDRELKNERSLLLGALALIAGITGLSRGLYLLTLGGGNGMLLIIPALIVIYLASSILRLPLAEIKPEKIIVYGLIFGKKEIALNQTFRVESAAGKVLIQAEDGSELELKTGLLNKKARAILANFIEYLKTHKS